MKATHGLASHGRQPPLADAVSCVAAPVVAISGPSGDISPIGAQGVFIDDVRVLSRLEVRLENADLAPVAGTLVGAERAAFQYAARGIGDPTPEPSVWVVVDRRVDRAGMLQHVTVRNGGHEPVDTVLRIVATGDSTPIADVRAAVAAHSEEPALRVVFDPTPVTDDPTWALALEPGGEATVTVRCSAEAAASGPAPWGEITADAGDARFTRMLRQGVADVAALYRDDGEDSSGRPLGYIAAGSPWYFTLFGRDSLWTARMLLPLGTETAMRTLRSLAARQGTRTDAATLEQPGKILHEHRRGSLPHSLPPTFYGSADATSLWIVLLSEAWRWGAPEAEVEALLPALRAALGWLTDHADADGDGLIEYREAEGIGEINQAWKDSPDSVHDASGRLGRFPLVLSEVQAYAYEAAMAGAELLEVFGAGDAAASREFAERLREQFRARFWTTGADRYPALALDADGRRADAVASNMGHLLGTGLLDAREERLVAQRLTRPDLLTEFGLRTLSSESPRYSPLSYHNGSIWPHDTAIAMHGLHRVGAVDGAVAMARALVTASDVIGPRLPELWGGEALRGGRAPLLFPTACRPQAWSAASSVLVLRTVLGLEVDVPEGVVRVNPLAPMPFGALRLRGLCGGTFDIDVDERGDVTSASMPDGLDLIVGD